MCAQLAQGRLNCPCARAHGRIARVGPESAGAVPGPAAYNKGGENPTVTDANVVLGYLPASQKLGGDMEIRKELAEKSMQVIADALGLSVQEAAEGIIKVVNERMFGAVRLVSVEKDMTHVTFHSWRLEARVPCMRML